MKKFLFLILILGLGLNSANADDYFCENALREHIELVQLTDEYFAQINTHASKITSFEITQVQKKLTQRFLSLKNLLALYADPSIDCKNDFLPIVVAIYDFSQVGKNIFTSKYFRRVLKGFVNFNNYQLTDYISYYKKFTNRQLVSNTKEDVKSFIETSDIEKIIFNQAKTSPSVTAISDLFVRGTTAIVAVVARMWGFISDHLAWREGRLKDNTEVKELLTKNLKPLDLIFEKRNFLLTNYTIPGHWGHVAVWLGTKEELIELGIWDQDYFAQFKEQVEAGRSIVEIRKIGINFQSLDTFINLDEVAITRIKNINENAEEIFLNLSEQIIKKYDFRFDAHSADKITCSELISFSYGDIPWHETKNLFQVSLRPDDMALSTLGKNPTADLILYLKGKRNKKNFEKLNFEEWSKLFKIKN